LPHEVLLEPAAVAIDFDAMKNEELAQILLQYLVRV